MTHPHHYRIETPHGHPTVTGQCLTCGYQRAFNAGSNEVGRAWATENGSIIGLGDMRDRRGDIEHARRAPREKR